MDNKDFRILIVEDEEDLRDVLFQLCRLNGYEADCARTGSDALILMAASRRYGLALVDYTMPDMHGVDFTLRAKRLWPHLTVIAMSAFKDVEESFIEAGAKLFLKKPFDMAVLEKAIADSNDTASRDIPGYGHPSEWAG